MTDIKPGTFYGMDKDGKIDEVGEQPRADFWACQRVTEFPNGVPPAGAAVDHCAKCGALVAYNPARNLNAPRVCMECAGFTRVFES